jgi:hypothetical protein
MTTRTQDGTSPFGWYIYGVVDSDVSLDKRSTGIGNPPSPVETVSSGSIAGLVSKIPVDQPIGSVEDLLAHQRVLDGTAVRAPVLPVRFGAVVDSPEAIKHELLEPNEETFAEILRELTGQVQYVLRARYIEDVLMREIVEEYPAAQKLRSQIEGRPGETTRAVQLQLGQLVSDAVESKRKADTSAALEHLANATTATSVRLPSHELDAAHIAMLVPEQEEDEMAQDLNDLAEMWRGRATIRVLGPMAPYDFVAVPAPEEMPAGAT